MITFQAIARRASAMAKYCRASGTETIFIGNSMTHACMHSSAEHNRRLDVLSMHPHHPHNIRIQFETLIIQDIFRNVCLMSAHRRFEARGDFACIVSFSVARWMETSCCISVVLDKSFCFETFVCPWALAIAREYIFDWRRLFIFVFDATWSRNAGPYDTLIRPLIFDLKNIRLIAIPSDDVHWAGYWISSKRIDAILPFRRAQTRFTATTADVLATVHNFCFHFDGMDFANFMKWQKKTYS